MDDGTSTEKICAYQEIYIPRCLLMDLLTNTISPQEAWGILREILNKLTI